MQTKRATSVALAASTLVTIVAFIGLNCDAFGIQASDSSISGKLSANLAALAAVSQFQSDAEPIVSNGQESSAAPVDLKQQQQQESQVASPSAAESSQQQSSVDKQQQRKGRADEQGSPSALTATPKADKTDKADKAPASQPTAGTKQDASSSASSTSATKSTKPVKSTSSNQQAKIGAKKAGPVTSTGNSGSHYLSKHDSYSAIAERHLFTDAMRKSDRRRAHSSMSGIEKAASFGNMFSNPLNGITDNGLARTLGASMRSMIKGKYSVPAYVASALLGAVALLAFYESPISPLPVPPLPEPPVGRFPPEMPNISPNLQVPFRTSPSNNAQQQYNQMLDNYQRSSYQPQQLAVPTNSQQQSSSSIMFPSSNSAQSRSGNQQQVSPIASLLPESVVGKSQAAQRKSSVDYELPLASRTLFGDYSALFGKQQPQMQLQVGQQLQPKSSPSTAASPALSSSSSSSSGILSYFGLGSSDSATTPVKVDAEQKNSNPSAASSLTNSIANSYLVTKVRSMFKASPAGASPASASASASAPSPLITSSSASAAAPESGKKLSLMQSLIKDSNFLPAFFSPSRKSPASSSSQSNSANPASAASSAQAQQHQFAERANQGSNLHYINSLAYIPQQQQQQQQQQPQLPVQQTAAASKQSGGYSLVKATERIAHALLDSIQAISTPRHAGGSSSMARKSPAVDDKPSIASAASLINDMVSGYSNVATSSINSNQDKQSAIPQTNKQLQQQSPEQLKSAVQKAVKESQVNARSDVQGSVSQSSQQQVSASAPSSAQSPSSAISNSESLQQASASVSAVVSAVPQQDQNQANQQQQHVRKTRSIGLDYPINSQYQQQQQYQQQVDQSQLVKPSRAAQINSVVDFVADSYTNNKLLFNLVMSQVGLANAVPYVDQILSGGEQQVN